MVCRAFKKRMAGQARSNAETWETSRKHSNETSVIMDPVDYYMTTPPSFMSSQSFLCSKQELSSSCNNLSLFMQSQDDQFVHLPQLQSPSHPPPMQNPASSLSALPESYKFHESNRPEEEDDREISSNNYINNKVSDWRALDKLVASQLNHDDPDDQKRYNSGDRGGALRLKNQSDSDVGLLLLQSGSWEDGDDINGFFSSNSDCNNIGICIFDK